MDRLPLLIASVVGDSHVQPFRWLVALGIMPKWYGWDIENLMTRMSFLSNRPCDHRAQLAAWFAAVCEPHAEAYNAEVWCWVPGSRFRGEMGDHAAPRPLEPLPDDLRVKYVQALLSDSDSDGVGLPAQHIPRRHG